MDITVRILPAGDNFTYQTEAGQSLAKALWLAPETTHRLTPPSLCSGLGRCGRCRVRFVSTPPSPKPADSLVLTEAELTAGWRLACTHDTASLGPSITLEVPPPPRPVRRLVSAFATVAPAHSPELSLTLSQSAKSPANQPTDKSADQPAKTRADTMHTPLRLAVDVGTTSLHWQALDAKGNPVAQGQEINPQMGAGADVMSRLAHARTPEGRKQLADRVIIALQDIISSLPAPVESICLAANTAMTYILLQKDCTGLATAPYSVPYAGHSLERLPPLHASVYIPPLPAPFVGGDLSAGMAHVLAAYAPRYPFLLADMGTNGEFVLALSPQHAIVTSVPLGPALEGMGLTFGAMAGPGAQEGIVDRFSVQPTGLVPHTLPATAYAAVGTDAGACSNMGAGVLPQPKAICATGYLSLLHCLFKLGVLEADGRFCTTPSSPLGQRVARQFSIVRGEQCLMLSPDESLYLTGRDVEEILKVKAAFSLAWEALLQATAQHKSPLTAADLQHVFLAGAFGEYVQADDLEALGILPAGIQSRVQPVGNSALLGATLLLTKPELRDGLALWSSQCTVLELTADPNFTTTYMRHMRFA